MSPRQFPDVVVSLATPSDMMRLVDQVKKLVDLGRLRQVQEEDWFGEVTKLTELTPDGPWPDLVHMVFCDVDGRRYRLEVETFHGAGGSWEPEPICAASIDLP